MPPTEEEDARERWAYVAQRVRDVAAACAAGGLARVRVASAELEIDVRRSALHVIAEMEAAVPAGIAASEQHSNNGVVGAEPEPEVLRADVVGIVRLSRPAVHEGAVLPADRELAYVESLGIRNPVSSRGVGRVVGIFVDDGQAVDYGQPLFAIER
jgi:biotin carboxyl carrier protein